VKKTRILFVDDEPGIRMTLPAILELSGYAVKTAATVGEALELIQRHKFDVLISDLNIGEPADGFIVVSAMRRLQPEAVTFILTGYPDFGTALEAIRQQVDDYLIKPADVERLLQDIKDKLERRHPHQPRQVLRAAEVLRANRAEIPRRYVQEWKRDAQLSRFGLSDKEIVNHLPALMADLLENPPEINQATHKSVRAAASHALTRRGQGFSAAQLVREMKLLRTVLAQILQENLLTINLSLLISDMIEIGQNLDLLLAESVAAFSDSTHEPAAA
jgi:YesN/AraC family two-component response regulator